MPEMIALNDCNWVNFNLIKRQPNRDGLRALWIVFATNDDNIAVHVDNVALHCTEYIIFYPCINAHICMYICMYVVVASVNYGRRLEAISPLSRLVSPLAQNYCLNDLTCSQLIFDRWIWEALHIVSPPAFRLAVVWFNFSNQTTWAVAFSAAINTWNVLQQACFWQILSSERSSLTKLLF